MMRQNRQIKPQDVVILGKLISDKDCRSQKEIADSLGLSQAEISHALKTLAHVGLINLATKKVNKLAVTEFITHALKFLFPIEKKGTGRGISIGPSSSIFKGKVQSDDYNYIWPDPDGDSKGVVITPLLSNLPKSAIGNETLFTYLNVIEIFRGLGGVRHLQEAQKILKEILK